MYYIISEVGIGTEKDPITTFFYKKQTKNYKTYWTRNVNCKVIRNWRSLNFATKNFRLAHQRNYHQGVLTIKNSDVDEIL